MHAEQEREFPAMMQIMLDQMPDDPLGREYFFLAALLVYISQRLIQVGDSPAGKHILDHLPGGFETTDQFRGGLGGLIGLVPLTECYDLFTAFFQDIIAPIGSRADKMPGDHANGAKVRC